MFASLEQELYIRTTNHVIDILVKYGNILSYKHIGAIHAMSQEAADILVNGKKSRTAFSLSTGAGKTTFIRGLILSIQELGLQYSLAISAEKVEALCELKRAIIEDGIEPSTIGLAHSYKHDYKMMLDTPKAGYASEPATDKEQWNKKQFLLLTHNKIKSKKFDVSRCYEYRSKPRDLVVWDESLITSNGWSLSVSPLVTAIGYFKTRYERLLTNGRNPKDYQVALYEHLLACEGTIENAIDGEYMEFPTPDLPLASLEEAVRNIVDARDEGIKSNLLKLVNFSNNKWKVVTYDGQGIIHFEISVPDYLDKIIILDASHPIRKLIHLDSSIQYDEELSFSKDYSDVTVNHWKGRASRDALEGEFLKGSDNKVSAEVVHICRNILDVNPEPILIFTYKAKNKVDIVESLKRQFEFEGVDLEATDRKGNRLINFLTWGNETNLNKFSFCKHVILAGILYRDTHDLGALALGQSRDGIIPDKKLINEIQNGEQAHLIYQAISRGNCRQTVNGKAGEMVVYLFHNGIGPIKELLDKVMPNAVWKRYEAEYMSNNRSKQEEVALRIVEALKGMPEDQFTISTSKFRKEYLPDVTLNLWREGMKVVQDYLDDNKWRKSDRSFARVMF